MPAAAGPVKPVESKPWQTGLAPVLIALFLWVAFFDQIGRRTVATAGIGWPVLGAVVAGLLNYWLLFHAPALWGQRTGRPLSVVSTATFGTTGATLVPGLLIGIAQVVWFAVAIGYAADLSFRGLELAQFVDARALRPIAIGGGGSIPSALVMITALVWCVVVALVGGWFVRWIAALMQVFPIFPALLLGATMLVMLDGLQFFRPAGFDALTGERVPAAVAGPRAALLTIQAVFAFTAMAGVAAADWGAASLGPRDVRLGGIVGVGMAPVVIVALAVVALAGGQGKLAEQREARQRPGAALAIADAPPPGAAAGPAPAAGLGRDVPPWTFREVVVSQFERRLACVTLMILGLASLAPACYAAYDFGQRFRAMAPGIKRVVWTVFGALCAWFLVVAGWHERVDTVFGVLGACFAPVAGAMAADRWRHRGEWPGARRGINPAGALAWGIGLAVGLVPVIGGAPGIAPAGRFQPASVWAFVAAFAAYLAFARLGLESGRDLCTRDPAAGPAPEPESDPEGSSGEAVPA